jgi:predicted ATPase
VNALPIQPTSLLGRERELREVVALLQRGARLVTLTGPGGVGKTRLAVDVAAVMADSAADGVVLVELALLDDPALVVLAISQALGLREHGGRPLAERLREHLASRCLLLLLDNFEHVVEAAPLVADLLATSPGLQVLVTTREPLHLRGEREYDVPPLALPRTDAWTPPAALARNAAVALFVERAAAIHPGLSVTDENASHIAEICIRLGLSLTFGESGRS